MIKCLNVISILSDSFILHPTSFIQTYLHSHKDEDNVYSGHVRRQEFPDLRVHPNQRTVCHDGHYAYQLEGNLPNKALNWYSKATYQMKESVTKLI